MGNEIPNFTLHDGEKMPAVGLGTFSLKGSEGVEAMKSAIAQGYRLLDTAYNYENEGAVGRAIAESGVAREELFVTSKLPGRYQEYDKALVALKESLYRANLDYVDLYLIHWPNPRRDKYVEAWQAMIDAQKEGLIKSLGVSNFLPEYIDRLEKETGVLPTVNQIELHPYFNQKEQRAYHAEKGIITQSWSALGRADLGNVLEIETVKEIAQEKGKSAAQVVLRWVYQLNTASIPRSLNAGRQKENISIFDFELSGAEMEKMNAISRPDGRLLDQNPAEYEEF